MKPQYFIQCWILGFIIIQSGCDDIPEIRTTISKIPKIDVPHTTDPIEVTTIPKRSVGFTGTGTDRRELFEESRKLTNTFGKYVAFDPYADALYPGSLIQGNGLPNGNLNPIKTKRNSLTITITDLVASGSKPFYSIEVKDPSLATITNGVNQILKQELRKQQPAQVAFTQRKISSVEEGLLKLGASYKWFTGKVSGSFQTNSSLYSTSHMVRYVQSYYTVSCEAPSDPAAFFHEDTKLEELENYMARNNPPTYIASVTYGRELWILIESNYDSNEVNGTLNTALSSGFVEGKIDLTAKQKQLLNESSIQILILGGSGESAVEVVAGDHVSALKSYLLEGANYSESSPGVIISYVVRYLRDNTIARVSSSTDYIIKTSNYEPETIFLSAMRVTWHTTNDNKNWNTQPVVDVFDKNGRHIGHISCCSADRHGGDEWNRGRVETRNMTILTSGITLEDIEQGRFSAKRNAGRDEWDYDVTVEFILSNGQKVSYACSGRNSCGRSW